MHYGGEVGVRTHYNLSEQGRKERAKNHPWKGKFHTEETKKKMSESAKKREAKKKENNYTVSEETRKKLKEASKRRIPKHKKVNQYKMNGDFIKTWESTIDAAHELRIDISTLRLAASGRYKSAGGYQWKYYNDDIKNNNIEPYVKTKIKNNRVKKEKKEKVKRMTKEEVSEFQRKNHSIKVNQYTLDGKYIRTYDSALQAHVLDGHHLGSIRQCCKYKMKTHHGYKWYNANDDNQPDKTKIIK